MKRLKGVESYHELHRLLQADETLRSLCDIEEREKPYDPSTLARFRQRVGPERLQRVMSHLITQLDKMGVIDVETIALDVTFCENRDETWF